MSELVDSITNLSPKQRAILEMRLKKKRESVPSADRIMRRRDPNVFPLSFFQQRLWFLDQYESDSSAYNIPGAVHLSGPLDVIILEKSLSVIWQRHEILRATFVNHEGQPRQIITPPESYYLPLIDLQEIPESEREAEVQRLATETSRRPFDLTQGPLLRTILLRLAEKEHVFLINVHHIVADGWSLGVFVRELGELYKAFSTGKPSPLPDLPIQYADFVDWQRQRLQGEVLNDQLVYWTRQLSGALPVLELPTDHPRPSTQTFRGARRSLDLSLPLANALKKISGEEKATLFMTLLATFKTFLHRYTGQTDIIVGSPIAGRKRPEVEGLIGAFINTLAFRTDLSDDPTFRELLGRVREVTLDGFAHQDMPFEKLVEELRPERNMSHSPLFQVMFALQNAVTEVIDLHGLALTPVNVDNKAAMFDLSLFMREERDGLIAVFEYNTDLFAPSTIDRMMTHFQMLLESIIANPDQRLSELPLLTRTERQQLLNEWNNTKMVYPEELCIHQLFEAQVEKTPDRVAAIFEDEQLTYQELNEQSNQLARHLRWLGVGPDTKVGIYVERSLKMIVGLLGVLKAGGAYVPLDPSFPQDRLAYMLTDSQASVLLTQQSLMGEDSLRYEKPVISLDSDWPSIAQRSAENLPNGAQSDDLAYVIYTSGSTGKPKGVQIRHKTVVNFLTSMRQEPGLAEKDILLSVTTLSFDIAVLEIFLPLTTGARVVLVSRETAVDGQRLMAALVDAGATVMQATPATWRILLECGWQGDDRLKILCGGEAFPRDLATQLLERCGSLWNMYGPTETTVWSAIYQVQPGEGLLPIGRPIGNTRLYLLDAHMQPVPIGVPGELYIGGKGLAAGYLNRPGLTNEKFVPDIFDDCPRARMYRSSDLARYLPDGNVEFIGRIDHQVKIRGFRIELGEIETVLTQYPATREAVIIVREDRPGDKRLAAYVVPKDKQIAPLPSIETEVRSFLRKQLPEYMVPSHICLLDRLPLTPNGKIDRRALPAPHQTRREPAIAFVAPRNSVEEKLAEMWIELLGLDSVGIYDNFFDLGGHSLLAPKLNSNIHTAFAVELSLQSIFATPTVADLAILIAQKKAEQIDSDRLTQLLDKLSAIEVEATASANGESHKNIEITNPAKRIAELPPKKQELLLRRLSLEVDQLAVPALEQIGPEPENYAALPRTPMETSILNIWLKILKLERISIDSDFFELGGTSLMASQLNSRLHDTFGVKIPFRRLFEALTISELAKVVEEAKASQFTLLNDQREIESLVDKL